MQITGCVSRMSAERGTHRRCVPVVDRSERLGRVERHRRALPADRVARDERLLGLVGLRLAVLLEQNGSANGRSQGDGGPHQLGLAGDGGAELRKHRIRDQSMIRVYSIS